MRILILDTTIDENLIGGGHLFLPTLIKGLISQGHELHLVVKGAPNKKVFSAIETTGAILHISPWDTYEVVEKQAPVFAHWINQLAPDIYLISASPDIGWVVLPFLDPDIATLTIGHTDDETFYLPARHYSVFLTGAIGVSREVCESYINSCNLDPSRVTWIPYGVQAAETFREGGESGPISIIYAGRVEEEQKRISDIIAISKGLTEQETAFELRIVGEGSEMPRLKKELEKEIAEKIVTLYGWVNSKKVTELMHQSDIFLLTSAYEGFCIALVEAMANGCCPVVSDIRSGNKDLVFNNENGFLVPVGNVSSFVQCITLLWKDPIKLHQFRNAAWMKGRGFTVQKMVDKYVDFFNKSVKLAKESPREIEPGFPLLPTCRSKYPNWVRNLKVLARKAVSKLNK